MDRRCLLTEPGRNATLQLRDALLKHPVRRIHDPGVDVSGDRKVEEIRTMLVLSNS